MSGNEHDFPSGRTLMVVWDGANSGCVSQIGYWAGFKVYLCYP